MISGKNLRLRGFEQADLSNMVRWLNDPEVIENLLIYTPLSSVDEQAWFENMLKKPKEEHAYVIEILEGEKWVPIGTTNFHFLDWKNRSAEIGLCIGEKKFWNHGYGRDTVRLMLRHAFMDLNLNRVSLTVFDTNERGKKAYLAAGFVEEGRLRQDIYKNGKYHDTFIMSVLSNEWQDAEV